MRSRDRLCRDGALGLTLDPQLMRDLTVLISSSVAGGMLLEAVKQPVINGYFIAGSVVGPGGLQLIKARLQLHNLQVTMSRRQGTLATSSLLLTAWCRCQCFASLRKSRHHHDCHGATGCELPSNKRRIG